MCDIVASFQWNFYAIKTKSPDALTSGLPIRLGGDLLSHGDAPHYHRHYGLSLLSSVWFQVVPPHYRRQYSLMTILSPFRAFAFLFRSFASLVLSLLTSLPARYTRPLQKQASNQLPSLNSLS